MRHNLLYWLISPPTKTAHLQYLLKKTAKLGNFYYKLVLISCGDYVFSSNCFLLYNSASLDIVTVPLNYFLLQSLEKPSMGDSNIQESIDDIDGIDDNHGLFKSLNDSSRNVNENGRPSQNFYINLMKCSLLLGAEKVLMDRKSPRPLVFSNVNACPIDQDSISGVRRQGKNALQKEYGNSQCSVLQECSDKNNQLSTVIDCPSDSDNELPLDFVSFLRILTVLALRLAGFQIGLFARFFTLPIQAFNIWVAFFVFPFHALVFAGGHLKKKLLTLWSYSCFSLIYFICDRFTMLESVLKLAVRFCWAFFWSVYVCLILVGMLVMGFVVGSVMIMRNVVVEPIQATENLNFDYTKTSPVSFVPITSTPVGGIFPGLESNGWIPFSKNVGGRPLPYNHKLQLVLSLTLPESDYNRNLGIFQVRLESLSEDGKVTASSSYPIMLKFKSQPIRFVETIIKSIPLLTGFQSESQNLKIEVNDFTEGHEPTACFKVSIEKRAEYDSDHGIPEIYAASLHIESQLSQLKRIMWNWRKTIFVWITIYSFLTELVFALICFRPVILPGRTRLNVIAPKGCRYRVNKISW